MNYWLVKTEPGNYSWDDLVKDKGTSWDGVRNYQARNNLSAMKKSDKVLVYHSVNAKSVFGIASVSKTGYPDPTADVETWVAVDLKPGKSLKNVVTLAEIKANKKLKDIALIRNSRLSVMPLTEMEFNEIIRMSEKA